MNHLRVNSIDEYQTELMGYNIIGNKIVYLTETDLCVVRVSKKFKKESAKIKGSSILNFVISRRGYLAFLYKNRTIEIRRMDSLNEIVHRFTNITIFSDGSYPKMKWDYDQLYLIYPENLEILDLKTKARKGYTDIVVDYQNEKMMDMVIANIMDSERAVILQLGNRLIFTIVPIPVSQLEIPCINIVLNLYSPSHLNDSRREFIAVLSNGKFLKIFNLLNLKQICQVDLFPRPNQLIQIESDANHECILVRYVSSATLEITKNYIYKINSAYYYCQNYNYYGQRDPFFTYKFQIPINENLTLFPMTVEELNGQIFDYYHLIFFKKGHLYSVFQFIPHSYSQTPTQLKYKTRPDWKEAEEWKEIISTYLQITDASIPKSQKNLNFVEQQRQLHQYNIIKQEFDSIIAKFTTKINEQNKKRTLNQKIIQDEWNQYMAQIAKERNFMLETMKLFKIQPQVIRKNQLQKEQKEQKIRKQAQEREDKERQNRHATIAKELQTCIREIQSRQERIDAKIKQKKKQIQVQKKSKIQLTTQEQKQKYQEDYQKFVAEFMLEKQKKQKQELQRKTNKQDKGLQIPQERLILALPQLNQQQRKTINNYVSENLNLSQHLHNLSGEPDHTQAQNNNQAKKKIAWAQMEPILKDIEDKITPFAQRFQPLIDRLKNVQEQGLSRIKKNQSIINTKCSLNLQEMVKSCCKSMLSNMNSKIKKQIENATRQIYKLQDKNKTYYEESIEKFKDYIRFQIKNRIEIYYKSRKALENRIGEMTKQTYAEEQGTKE